MPIQPRLSLSRIQTVAHTLAILAMMAGLFGLLGYLIMGPAGLFLSSVLCVILFATTPRIAPGLILRMYGARALDESEAPGLYAVVNELSGRAGLTRKPRIYYIPSRVMNAFSVGNRQASAIAITDGIVRYLNGREIAGVLGHEIGHIRNNDLYLYSLADMLSRVTSALSLIGQMLIAIYLPLWLLVHQRIPLSIIMILFFAPSLATLMQLALSRTREYAADLAAVELTGDSLGLAAALMKMERYQSRFWEKVLLPGRKVPDPSVLRTHPHTAERIERLRLLGEGQPYRGDHMGVMLPDHFPAVDRQPRWHWLKPWH
jgi:heat shock protein HtpX